MMLKVRLMRINNLEEKTKNVCESVKQSYFDFKDKDDLKKILKDMEEHIGEVDADYLIKNKHHFSIVLQDKDADEEFFIVFLKVVG